MLATAASLIAPFGGFFASGLKHTFKIKDFGDSIPGHGGMTDRMDCQFIMGTIAFMYYSSFIAVHKATVGGILESAITGLTPEEQIEVVKGLSKHLVNQDIIPAQVSRNGPLLESCPDIPLGPGVLDWTIEEEVKSNSERLRHLVNSDSHVMKEL